MNNNTDFDDDETKSHPPNEAFEISESENDEANNNIHLTSNQNEIENMISGPDQISHPPQPYLNTYPNNKSYSSQNVKHDNQTDKYIKKIQEQANRLQKNEMYISLCEKKIKMTNPNQVFPITEKDLEMNINVGENESVVKFLKSNEVIINFFNEKQKLLEINQENLELFINEYVMIKNKNNMYKKDLLSCNNILNALKKENEELKKELQDMKEILDENNSRIKEDSLKYNELLIEKGNLSSQYFDKESQMASLLIEYNKLIETNNQTSNENVELLSKLYSLKSMVGNKNKEIDELKDLLHKNTEKLQNEKEELINSSYKLAENKFNSELQDLQNKISEKEKEINQLNESNTEQENEMMKLKKYLNELEEKYEKILKKANFIEKTYENEKKENLCVFDEIKNQNDNLEEENQNLKKNMKNLEEELNNISTEFNQLNEDYLSLKDQFKTIKKENEKMSKYIVELEIDNNKLLNQSKSLSTEIKFTKTKNENDYEKLKNEIENLKEQNEKYQNKNEQLLIENNNLMEKQSSLVNQINSLSSIEKHFNIETKKNINTIKLLEKECNELKQENEELTKKIKNSNQTLNSIKDQLLDKQLTNESLLKQKKTFIEEFQKVKMSNQDNERHFNDLLQQISNNKTKIRNNEHNHYLSQQFLQLLVNPSLSISLFIDLSTEEIECLINKIGNMSNQILNLQKENNNLQYDLHCSNNQKEEINKSLIMLTNEKNKENEQVKRLSDENEKLFSKINENNIEIDKLKSQNEQKEQLLLQGCHKTDYLEELISFYEMTKSQIENVLVEMSKFLRNTNLKFLTTELIQKNFDLINLGRDITNKHYSEINIKNQEIEKEQIQIKINDIFFIIDNINKEFKIEQKLFNLTKNFPYTHNSDLPKELSDAKDKLRESYTNYQHSYYSTNK